MSWEVCFKKKAAKGLKGLPKRVSAQVFLLADEIKLFGPVRGNWKSYSKLGGDKHHCHVQDGRPSYVVCWEVVNRVVKIVEIYYVGTREKAPY